MSKHEPRPPIAFGNASGNLPHARRGGSGSVVRPPIAGEIGFVGLGHMGTAMATNLAAAGRRVIAYVRRPDRMDKLVELGLKPTTDMGDLLDCELVISMVPDDAAVREVVFGRNGDDLGGLRVDHRLGFALALLELRPDQHFRLHGASLISQFVIPAERSEGRDP